jgi:glucose-1-phosphate thymidylyltransferase
MLPAGTRPILGRVFDSLIDAGIDDLHVVVGYQSDRVRNHFGPTYRNRTITYHTQETQLGSGHALLQATEAIDDDFLVLNGDEVVTPATVSQVATAHTRADVATLGVIESNDPTEYAGVAVADGQVTTLDETPKSGEYGLFNAGVYAFGPSIFSEIEATSVSNGERALSDTISELIDRTGNVQAARVESPRIKATYPWDLLELTVVLLDSETVELPERYPGVFVAETAAVHESAALRPPVVVAPDAVIEPNAVVGPNTSLGQNTTVAAGATVRRSVIDQDAKVGENAALRDVVTGVGATVGPATTVPGGPADVRVGTTIHEDQTLGAVIADRVTIGGNATLVSGTLIGPETNISPAATIRTNIDGHTQPSE